MPRFIPFLVVAFVVQLGVSTVSADELWTYYFTADGTRPYFQVPNCLGDCNLGGMRADLAGTFSILLNWQTGTGRLYSVDAQMVNKATWQTTGAGDVFYPLVPSYSTTGIFPYGTHAEFADSTFTYNQGNGRLKSPDVTSLAAQPYEIAFGLTNATLTMSITTLPYFITDVYPPSATVLPDFVYISNAHATLLNARIAGEFTNDSRIDARDYVAWRKSGGAQLDFALWRKYYGTSAAVGAGAGVPEPSTLMLMAGALGGMALKRHRS